MRNPLSNIKFIQLMIFCTKFQYPVAKLTNSDNRWLLSQILNLKRCLIPFKSINKDINQQVNNSQLSVIFLINFIRLSFTQKSIFRLRINQIQTHFRKQLFNKFHIRTIQFFLINSNIINEFFNHRHTRVNEEQLLNFLEIELLNWKHIIHLRIGCHNNCIKNNTVTFIHHHLGKFTRSFFNTFFFFSCRFFIYLVFFYRCFISHLLGFKIRKFWWTFPRLLRTRRFFFIIFVFFFDLFILATIKPFYLCGYE